MTAVTSNKETVLLVQSEASAVLSNVISNTLLTSSSNGVITLEKTSQVVNSVANNQIIVTGLLGPAGAPATSEEDIMYSKRIDFISDSEMYRGEAITGASESASVWRIRKIESAIDGDISETWASGSALFNKVWADRLTYIYS